jgi:hypothetical protein
MNQSNLVYLLFLFVMLLTRCDNIDLTVDCAECYQNEPEWGDIFVDVTINDENQYVPIIIYRGEFENNDIEYIDTAYESEYIIDVPLNLYYSVKAEYIVGSDTIYAIDGDKIKTKLNTEDCDQECYVIKGGNFDVRLKEF